MKLKRIVRKKPPEKGYVHWDRATFDRLVSSQPEPLASRFQVSHGMLLNVLERRGSCLDVGRLIHRSHERRAQQRMLAREVRAMFQSLLDAEVVEVDAGSKRVRVHVNLQEDFSLHHALSLWLVDTVARLDPASDLYALDVLTLVESILEHPEFILRQQLEALKRVKLGELKAAGVEYEQRVEELEKLEHPKPLREFVYETFNEFARAHPWVRGDDVRPKSIAREMFERFMDFNEYVREYELGRAEGTLLRYLSDTYKALVQTVPAPAKTPEVEEIEVFLRAMIRAVDSSLLDEWERMRHRGGPFDERGAGQAVPDNQGDKDVTRDERAFTVLVRNAMARLMQALARKDWSAAAGMVEAPLGSDERWTGEQFQRALAPFFAEHAGIRTDATARGSSGTRISKGPASWGVVQVIADAEGEDDWALSCFVDLDASARAGEPVLKMGEIFR